MKLLFTFLLLGSLSIGNSQDVYYNEFLEELGTHETNVFLEHAAAYCKSKWTTINDQKVREFYNVKTNVFYGVKWSNTKDPDFTQLPFIVRSTCIDKNIGTRSDIRKSLVLCKYGLMLGMDSDEISSILGKPDHFVYSIDKEDQILTYHYLNIAFRKLIFRENQLINFVN